MVCPPGNGCQFSGLVTDQPSMKILREKNGSSQKRVESLAEARSSSVPSQRIGESQLAVLANMQDYVVLSNEDFLKCNDKFAFKE